jgi:aldehyde:ferredoxin oxidoreductase
MEKVIRVNMTNLQITESTLPEKYRGLGGRAITSAYVEAEVPPLCDPLGKHNKLVIAPGLLAGTGLSSSGRISIGCKSPMTGGIKECNAGGVNANKLANLGIKAVIIEGLPEGEDLYILYINKDETKLIVANELKGMGNYALAEELKNRYGQKIGIVSIGPAGEMLLNAAGITNMDKDGVPSRYSARGAVGVVMGVKRIKAIVLDDEGARNVSFNDRKTFNDIARQLHSMLRESPGVEVFSKFGTAVTAAGVNKEGGLPTKNFRFGRFDDIDKINHQVLYDNIVERGGEGSPTHACMPGCLVKCSNIYPDKDGKAIVSPIEYETIGLCGSNCGIGCLDVIARINYFCNDFGLDTIEIGATIGLAMEAGFLEFGDGEKALELLQEIDKGTILGRLLGSGAEIFGRAMGIKRIPTVKGQAMAAYDPRSIKGNGVTYATSPMGADHTAGNTVRAADHHSPENKATVSYNSQVISAAYDSLGLCLFVGSVFNPNIELVVKMVSAKEGVELPADYMTTLGKKILGTEIDFNKKAGIGFNRMTEFMEYEPLPPFDLVFDVPQEELDNIYADITEKL